MAHTVCNGWSPCLTLAPLVKPALPCVAGAVCKHSCLRRLDRPLPCVAAITAALALVTCSRRGQRALGVRRCTIQKEPAPSVQGDFKVYIEDTDCFGVVFYANYFKYFQRLLRQLYASEGRTGLPTVVAVEKGRYAGAARLGDLLSVHLTEETVESSADAPALRQFFAKSVTSEGLECVSARLSVAEVGTDNAAIEPPVAVPSAPLPAKTWATPISAFEEFSSPPSLLDVLRWFERSRTDALGGPGQLGRVQTELGVLIVVARITDVNYDPAAAITALSAMPLAGVDGSAFEVRSSLELKRKDTQIVFDQRLYFAGSPGYCLARAVVTCLCVSASGMRMVSCPEELRERLQRLLA